MTAVYTIQAEALEQLPAHLTPEAIRELLHAQDRTLTDAKKRFAALFYQGRERWGLLYPSGSDRQYILWFLSPGSYNGSFQASLDAGLAQARGFIDTDWRYGEIAAAGAALRDNVSAAEIRERRAAGLPIRPPKREVTTIQIPTAHAEEIRATRDAVSESDTLTRPEATARIVLGYAGQVAPVREAIRDTEGTGRDLLSALSAAHAPERQDYRAVLKQQPCCVCGVRSGVELHHIRLEADERYRTHDYLVPLCTRHHIARPGDSTDSIHAMRLEAVKNDAALAWAAFRAISDAAEATRPTVTPIIPPEPDDPAPEATGADA